MVSSRPTWLHKRPVEGPRVSVLADGGRSVTELAKMYQGFKQEGVPLMGWMEELRIGLGVFSSCPVLRDWPTVI